MPLPGSALLHILYRESGLASLSATGRDAILLITARSARMLAYGATSLVLALFFAELGVPDARIGLFMTLTLCGDVVLGLGLTLVADQVGRRRTLFFGSALMMASGAAFALSENYWVLLAAAVVGVISATGGDFGPFRAIEESVISELTDAKTRPEVLSWYVTTAALGSAGGTEITGRVVEALRGRGWSLLDAYHACFWGYVVMGVVNMVCSSLLSERCELKSTVNAASEPGDGSAEMEAFISDSDSDSDIDSEHHDGAEGKAALPGNKASGVRLSRVSWETLRVMLALWFLLMVDSLADGMTSMTLTTYFIDRKFHLPKSTLGDVLSASYFLSTAMTVFAGPLSRHIGLVNTMVFTHIPSSAAVLLFPFPSSPGLTFALLLLRVGLNNMDQAPRAALIAAVVKPEERTAVMGLTGMLRTLAATAGPSVTGLLAGGDRFWIAFVVAGALRLAYDVGLFVLFLDIRLHRHEAAGGATAIGSRRVGGA